VVSALVGVANGRRYIALRQSVGGPQWRTVSPGRLLDEQTAHHFHDRGHVCFDFGIGDYHHKAALKLQPIALHQACVALSWRGWPRVAWWHLRRWLKRQPGLQALRQRLAQRRSGGGTTAAAGLKPRD
jgi:CelD/BcsL family acetyltransferase involved in cellulose biosynthesis